MHNLIYYTNILVPVVFNNCILLRTNTVEGRYNDSSMLVADDEFTTTYSPTNLSKDDMNHSLLQYLVSDGNGTVLQYFATENDNSTLTLVSDSTEDTDSWSNFLGSQEFYIVMYTIFIILSMILTPARSFMFYKIFMNASKGLHKKMFSNVLAAPMRFFDTNPSGKKTHSSNHVRELVENN